MGRAPSDANVEILLTSLMATLVLNGVLVYWALLPLRTLEATAVRVSNGDLAARFTSSPFADRNITRIGRTVNELLDHLTNDRERARHLASQVISAADRERARIARELHDSTAQSLSGLEMMLSAAVKDPASGASGDQLRAMHEIARQAVAEARTLSHTVHPRVLDDLGLVAAIEQLVRRTRHQARIDVSVSSDVAVPLSNDISAMLYRVAQEAIGNAVRHARAKRLEVGVRATGDHVVLDITDDGIGFDEHEAAQRGLGLFSMRERVALVNGSLAIHSAPGRGTCVRAQCPIAS